MTDPSPEYRDTALSFDWEAVKGRTVTAVMARVDLEVGTTAIALVLGETAVILTVDEDYDQVSIANEPFRPAAGEIWGPLDSLADLVGRPLGWCWETRNHRGYLDGFMVAFGHDVADGVLTPNRLFLADEARLSVLKVGEA